MDSDYIRQYRLKNKDKIKANHRAYYRRNKDKVLAYYREYRQNNKDKVNARYSQYCKREYVKVKRNQKVRKEYQNIRSRLYVILGGAKCVRCGEHDIRTLQFDHVFNDGAKDRARFRYLHLILRYYVSHPEEAKLKLQVLCVKCNWLKRYEPAPPLSIEIKQAPSKATSSLDTWVRSS